MASPSSIDTTEAPKAKPPPYNPEYRPQSNPYQSGNYPPAQQRPYYQGGYPQAPNVTIVEQPFADPYMMAPQPRETIIIEESYPGQYRQGGSQWEREYIQPRSGNVVYMERDPYRRNDDDMMNDCLLGTCCASLLCCCLLR